MAAVGVGFADVGGDWGAGVVFEEEPVGVALLVEGGDGFGAVFPDAVLHVGFAGFEVEHVVCDVVAGLVVFDGDGGEPGAEDDLSVLPVVADVG